MSFQKLEIVNRCTDRLSDKQMDTKQKKIQNNNTFVNAGLPDTEYLCYILDVECVTLNGLLLLASTR